MIKGLNHLAAHHFSPLYIQHLILTALQKEDPSSRDLVLSNYRSPLLAPFRPPSLCPSRLLVFSLHPSISDSLLLPAGYFPYRSELLRSFPKYQRKRVEGLKSPSLTYLHYLSSFIPSCSLFPFSSLSSTLKGEGLFKGQRKSVVTSFANLKNYFMKIFRYGFFLSHTHLCMFQRHHFLKKALFQTELEFCHARCRRDYIGVLKSFQTSLDLNNEISVLHSFHLLDPYLSVLLRIFFF